MKNIADDLNTHMNTRACVHTHTQSFHYLSANMVARNPRGICDWLLFFSPHLMVVKEWLVVKCLSEWTTNMLIRKQAIKIDQV